MTVYTLPVLLNKCIVIGGIIIFRPFTLIISLILILSNKDYVSEIVKIKSFDNTVISGKLDLPSNVKSVPALVVFFPGTGPNTYENHRKINNIEFNYYDLFAQELSKRGIAFFRYNTRGVETGDQPPSYDLIKKIIN